MKKIRENKGFTGADVAVAICVIALTLGIVTSIYINVTSKTKENIRYSAATRIATGLTEKIQSITYGELVYEYENSYTKSDFDSDGSVLGISVPARVFSRSNSFFRKRS